MSWSIFDSRGRRKYLIATERQAFMRAALAAGDDVMTFCAVLVFCGARISEALALTHERIDAAEGLIIFETLKRRQRGIVRAVPVPHELFALFECVHDSCAARLDPARANTRLWVWSRTTAWRRVKEVMRDAGIPEYLCKPKALRHGFCIAAVLDSIVITLISKWLGHARLETTQEYTKVVGPEERALASRTWRALLPSTSRDY